MISSTSSLPLACGCIYARYAPKVAKTNKVEVEVEVEVERARGATDLELNGRQRVESEVSTALQTPSEDECVQVHVNTTPFSRAVRPTQRAWENVSCTMPRHSQLCPEVGKFNAT